MSASGGSGVPAPRFGDVLRRRYFVVPFIAETQSVVGDQLARVALSILVYQWTGSVETTALTYAISFLPAIAGGLLLGGIGDRFPRRVVMVLTDLTRAACFGVVAIPAVPLPVTLAVFAFAVLLGPLFTSSTVSFLAGALDAETFRVGNGLRMITNQSAQVAGFAAAGVIVAVIGPHVALLVNSSTYLVSALLIAASLRSASASDRASTSPAPDQSGAAARPGAHSIIQAVWFNPKVRALLTLSSLAGLFVVPEGLAIPFGDRVGASTVQVGLLLAAIPLGGAVGAGVLVRLVPKPRRQPVAGVMAITCGVPLGISALVPHWGTALVLWFISGALAAYQVELFTAIVAGVPDTVRARVVSVGGTVLLGAQGLGIILFGWVAMHTTTPTAIGLAGVLGSVLALLLVMLPLRQRRVSVAVRSGGTPTHRANTRSPHLPKHRSCRPGVTAPRAAATPRPEDSALRDVF